MPNPIYTYILNIYIIWLDWVLWHINHCRLFNAKSSLYIYIEYTGWNDKIVALEKTTWFYFRLMKTGFLFFVADHLLVDQLCTNPKSDWSLLSCLKVTMFIERDRRCTTVQFMLSTNANYENRTIASTLKMQIWIAMNNRNMPWVMKTKLWSLVWFQMRATSCHLTSSKLASKSTPKCT